MTMREETPKTLRPSGRQPHWLSFSFPRTHITKFTLFNILHKYNNHNIRAYHHPMRREGVSGKIIPRATTLGFYGMGPLAMFFKRMGRRGIKGVPSRNGRGGAVKLFPARSVAMSARSSPAAHSRPLNIAQWLKNSHRSSITHLNLCDEMPPDQKLLTKMLITHKLVLVNIFYPL